jgi:hypothetical protein
MRKENENLFKVLAKGRPNVKWGYFNLEVKKNIENSLKRRKIY